MRGGGEIAPGAGEGSSAPTSRPSLGAGPIVGLGVYWAWTFFSFNQAIAPTAPLFVLHVVSMLGASVAYLAVAALWRRLAPLCERRLALVVLGAVSSLTTLPYLVPGTPDAVAVAGAFVSGFAIAPVVCALGERFCAFPARDLLRNTALFLLLGYAVMLALSLVSQSGARGVAVALVAAVPVLSSLALLAPSRMRDVPAPDAAAGGSAPRQVPEACGSARAFLACLPWRALAVIACMYFAVGGLRVYVEHVAGGLDMGTTLLAVCVVVLALALVATYGLTPREGASLAPFYKIAMPLVAVGYMVLVAVGPQIPEALSSIAHLTCLFCSALCWVLAAGSVHGHGLPALPVMAVSRFMVNAGMALGELAGFACLDAMLPFAVVTVLVLVLSFVFLFSDREALVGLGPVEPAGGCAGPVIARQVEAAGTDVPHASASNPNAPVPPGVAAWGLTERECAVLELWVTSHGARSIGEGLGLSESTVKTHIRHIYEKSGVRNRAELIGLLDELRSQAENPNA